MFPYERLWLRRLRNGVHGPYIHKTNRMDLHTSPRLPFPGQMHAKPLDRENCAFSAYPDRCVSWTFVLIGFIQYRLLVYAYCHLWLFQVNGFLVPGSRWSRCGHCFPHIFPLFPCKIPPIGTVVDIVVGPMWLSLITITSICWTMYITFSESCELTALVIGWSWFPPSSAHTER